MPLYAAGVSQLIPGLNSCSAGPSGLWHWALRLECGEDAQMKTSEMLPFVAATDNSMEEENVIIIVLFQRQRAVKGQEHQRVGLRRNGFSFLLYLPV